MVLENISSNVKKYVFSSTPALIIFIIVSIILAYITGIHKPIIFFAGIILAGIILYMNEKYYTPYFFPELQELKNKGNINNITSNTTFKKDLILIKGILPMSNEPIKFITNPLKKDNIDFHNSINLKGGAQFSYSFWLNKNKENELKGLPIIHKGDRDEISDSDVACPLIKFGDDSKQLIIEFNTNKDKDRNDGTYRNNSRAKITVKNELFDITDTDSWFLITVVFQDSQDFNTKFDNGINVKVYLNDTLMVTNNEYKNQVLVLNKSPLYILPKYSSSNSSNSAELADIVYYNYALQQPEIKKIYKQKNNNDVFTIVNQDKDQEVSAKYLELNLFNKTRDI